MFPRLSVVSFIEYCQDLIHPLWCIVTKKHGDVSKSCRLRIYVSSQQYYTSYLESVKKLVTFIPPSQTTKQ